MNYKFFKLNKILKNLGNIKYHEETPSSMFAFLVSHNNECISSGYRSKKTRD